VGKSGDQRFERFDEDRSFLLFELVQGIPDLGFAQLAEMGAYFLRSGRGGDQHSPSVRRIRSAEEMTGIDEAIDQLGGCGHRAVEGRGNLTNGHLPTRSQLEQHLYLGGRQAMGVAEPGDRREEGFGDEGQQLHAGFD
jgi:hypothetical protein